MIHTTRLLAASLAATTLLTGCHALPPLHYYALDAVAPATGTAVGFTPLIHIRHLTVPHEMDHLGLTHHTGPTQLSISDNDQWSAPLTDLIQGTLTRDLGSRLGFDHVVAPDALPAGGANVLAALDLDFVTLSADEGCGVDAQVNWTYSAPTAAGGSALAPQPRRGSLHVSAASGACPGGLPTALSTVLGQLADQLAQQLTAAP